MTAPSSTDLTAEDDRIAREIEASLCVDSLAFFVERAWPLLDPTKPYLPSIAIDAMCAALQAVAEGRIQQLAISIPPGVGKSLVGAVAFPAWMLLRTRGKARVMAASYSNTFATRDSKRCRDLVQNEWFGDLVLALGKEWGIRDNANHEDDWWTTATGRRLTAGVRSGATGERCSIQVIDDALNAIDAISPAAKAEAVRWVSDVLSSRLEDQRSDPRVIIGQRLAVDDPIADAIVKGWTYLCIPVFLREGFNPCILLDDAGVEVWRDPRTPGDRVPLVELLDEVGVARLKKNGVTPTALETQYYQNPGDDSAATFKRTSWNWYGRGPRPAGADTDRPARSLPSFLSRVVVTADLTFGSLTGDYASVQAWGEDGPDRYLLKARRGRCGFNVSKAWIVEFAKAFPGSTLAIEKAANGHAVIEDIKLALPNVKELKPWGKKVQRHAAAVPTVDGGNAWLPLGDVFEEVDAEGAVTMVDASGFLEEHAGATKHDDQMDASSYAIIELNGGAGYTPAPVGGSTIEGAASAPRAAADVPSIWSAIYGQ